MTHQGPDPSEALPVGEESLTPDELDRLAGCVFELEEIGNAHLPNQVREEDVTPEQWQVIQSVKAHFQGNIIEALKKSLIDSRE